MMKCFLMTLVTYGLISFMIGMAGFAGVYDPYLRCLNADFEAKALDSYGEIHSGEQTADFQNQIEFWLGFTFFMRHMTHAAFLFLASVCWTDAWDSCMVK